MQRTDIVSVRTLNFCIGSLRCIDTAAAGWRRQRAGDLHVSNSAEHIMPNSYSYLIAPLLGLLFTLSKFTDPGGEPG